MRIILNMIQVLTWISRGSRSEKVYVVNFADSHSRPKADPLRLSFRLGKTLVVCTGNVGLIQGGFQL
jgi:hypothetical protein